MQMINTFWQELQESWEQIKEFYKKTKVLRWFGACLMFVNQILYAIMLEMSLMLRDGTSP